MSAEGFDKGIRYTDAELERMGRWGGYSEPIKPKDFIPENAENIETDEANRQKLEFVSGFLSDTGHALSKEQLARAREYMEEDIAEGIASLGVEISQMPVDGVTVDKKTAQFGKFYTIADLGLGAGNWELLQGVAELIYSDGFKDNEAADKIEIKNANIAVLGYEEKARGDVKRRVLYVFMSPKYLMDYNEVVLQHNSKFPPTT
ncbi:MAG: hypothetical protein UX79_C0017G0003 [candidate division WWE3 bacterium GW2011_GWB1_47_11]|uniref:Uncharacterized protein n=1 Tax=candidate division WWE3 bacterium GW2011_GWB1_47_11 TaxID=1619117 RepID=A0A0G1RIW0_UNCKA|nr:MAG: hypothetical protein UX79_C0017G0003 [candidate division WWE3 bacterium GW2011_GWB1_47_11]